MRNILQLGLANRTEWIYLTADNWVEMMSHQKKEHQLPDFYTQNPEPFRYFGVDVSPSSINEVRDSNKDHQNSFFIACGISDRFSIENFPNRYYSEETHQWYDYIREKDNTRFIFVPFTFLLDNMEIEDIAVLAVDVDGYEPEIFSTIHQWSIKPEFITIEMSVQYPQGIDQIIMDAGYTHIRTMPQYSEKEIEENPTQELEFLHEQQFLRNDIYVQNRETVQVEHIYFYKE